MLIKLLGNLRKAAVITILVLIACCGSKPDIDGRKAFWEGVINRELTLRMSESAIKDWGKKRGIEFSNTGGFHLRIHSPLG